MKQLFFKFKGLNILIIIFICLTTLSQVSAALLLSKVLNSAVAGNVNLLLKSFTLTFCLWMLYSIFELIYSRLQSKCIAKMNNHLRSNLTNSLSNMNYQEYTNKEIGSYVSWYTNDMNEIETSVFKALYSIIYKIISLIFVIGAITNMHYYITITMLVASAILIIVPKFITKKIANLSLNQSMAQESFTKDTKDILTGFPTLKIYNSLPFFKSKINQLSSTLENSRIKLAYAKSNVTFGIGILNVMCQLSCSLAAAYLATIGKIEIGAILAVGNLSGNCFNSLKLMINDMVTLAGGKKVFEKINTLSQYTDQTESNKEKLQNFDDSIILQDISYSYGDNLILDNVNLKFEKGKKYALIGPSGCGKSTLLKILMGYIDDFEGNILINNKSIKDYDIKSIYNSFAYIDQNVHLFNTTVLDNLTVFKQDEYTEEDILNSIKNSSLDDFLDSEKLDLPVGENGNKLSGGQKQRISIARALINKKPVIIIDEGTSALDKSNSYAIEEKLLNNPDITLILVSHNLNKDLINLFDNIYDLSSIKETC